MTIDEYERLKVLTVLLAELREKYYGDFHNNLRDKPDRKLSKKL